MLITLNNHSYINNIIKKKDFNLPTFHSLSFIEAALDSKVSSGELSLLTEENFPFRHYFFKDEIKRKVLINTVLKNIELELAEDFRFKIENDNATYQCEEITTPIVIEKYDTDTELSDHVINQILDFCKEEGITHIFNIGLHREGIVIDKLNESIDTQNHPINLDEFEYFTFNPEKYVKTQYHPCCEWDYDSPKECYPYSNDEQLPEGFVSKKGYVFNKAYYTIIGTKVVNKNIISEWQKCINSLDYFMTKYKGLK